MKCSVYILSNSATKYNGYLTFLPTYWMFLHFYLDVLCTNVNRRIQPNLL